MTTTTRRENVVNFTDDTDEFKPHVHRVPVWTFYCSCMICDARQEKHLCDDCKKVLKGFVLGQKEARKRYDEGYRGDFRYT